MKLQFRKMSGAGNDFVVIDNRAGVVQDREAMARRLCDRRWGIGADGLLLLEATDKADYRMMYYNADGSYGGMCGNGGRCIARFATDNGIAGPKHTFEALGYLYSSVVRADEVVLSMKDPTDIRMNIVLRVANQNIRGHFINTGSPHFVIPIFQFGKKYRSLEDVPVEQLGKKLRYHRQFKPEGTNVNFVERGSGNLLKMRTYERGVEAETLACGTGSIASAIISARLWKLGSPISIIPRSGVRLEVAFRLANSGISQVTLKGQALTTFEGVIDVE